MTLEILGCKLDDIGATAATARIVEFARSGANAQVVTLGTEMVVYAQRDAAFRTIVNASALSLCDTVGLLMVARMRGSSLRERVTGVELIDHLCSVSATLGLGVYLLGAAPGIAEQAAAVLRQRFPMLAVSGTHDGYFEEEASAGIAGAIKESGASLLFVGLGSPRQEFWIAQHMQSTGCGVAIGVGGSFDVISGNVARAPARWQRLGVEWLYRLVREPSRWRRQLALPYFVWLVLVDSLRNAGSRKLFS